MIEEKTIPLHELKYYYSEHLGFVFKGASPSSDGAIGRLSHSLMSWGVAKKLPEFFVRVSENEVAFVYDSNSGFQSAPFFRLAQQLHHIGIFEIDILASWLKDK
jgi:hypothetical protein